jgi:hypothetical protein
VTAAWATADATATGGSDYVTASGTLTFAPGETAKTVDITVNGDDTVEGHERFVVSITSIAGASPGRGAGAVVVDDDGPTAPDATIAAAGDIACSPDHPEFNAGAGVGDTCAQMATSDLLVASPPDVVLTVGDNQYEKGTAAEFASAFDPSWGRFKSIIRPAVGNHEYYTAAAVPYYAYFGSVAGDPAQGWYSFDVGAWHVVELNSNCADVGGCGLTSPQAQWLTTDLATNPAACTLAFFHHPRFSSGGEHGGDTTFDAFWQLLYAGGADLILNGHDHDFERFSPQSPSGAADSVAGIREFVVGTGGREPAAFGSAVAHSESRATGLTGVLRMTLRGGSYDWSFQGVPGETFTDAGTGSCH